MPVVRLADEFTPLFLRFVSIGPPAPAVAHVLFQMLSITMSEFLLSGRVDLSRP